MESTKDRLITAIRGASLGAIEDLKQTYLLIAEEFLTILNELGGGYGMAQWGYTDLLAELLPNYYRGHGGFAAFSQDISTVYGGGTVQAARMGYHADRQPAKPVQLDFRPSPAQGSTTTQASLDALGQLARNAVQVANVTLHPASEVLPVALRGVPTLKQVA